MQERMRKDSLLNDEAPNHLQVEVPHASYSQNVISHKSTWLLSIGLCFAGLLAGYWACAALPLSPHANALSASAQVSYRVPTLAFNPVFPAGLPARGVSITAFKRRHTGSRPSRGNGRRGGYTTQAAGKPSQSLIPSKDTTMAGKVVRPNMSTNTPDSVDAEPALDLNNIRDSLMRLEDSIIFGLIERSQYRVNNDVYEPDCQQLDMVQLAQLKSAGSNGCLGDWFIYQSECLHAQFRRYKDPTEFAFFGSLPEVSELSQPAQQASHPTKRTFVGLPARPLRTRKASQGALVNKLNILAPVPTEALINSRLLDIYRQRVVPTLCEEGDDGNLGSTAEQDVKVLQAMATRIYHGLFVAESKFRADRAKATELIKAQDRAGLMAFVTKSEVEERLIQRVMLKARTFSQNILKGHRGQLVPDISYEITYKLDPEYIGTVFRDFLMPLTKDVEVEYLLARLEHEEELGSPSKA